MFGFWNDDDARRSDRHCGHGRDERMIGFGAWGARAMHEMRRGRGFGGEHSGPPIGGPGFGEGFFGGRGRGGGGRGRFFEQGDLRWLVLDLIAEQPRHGYEVIKAIDDALQGNYAPSPGAIYPLLTMFEETGLIVGESQGNKKLYRLTDAGREELEANKAQVDEVKARFAALADRFAHAPAPELFRAMGNLRGALQVRMSKGEISPEALAKITAAIDQAAREIEQS